MSIYIFSRQIKEDFTRIVRSGKGRCELSLIHSGLGSIWIRTRPTPCTGLSKARQVLARPHPVPGQFQLWWRGQTFYSTRPIIGLFDLPHLLSLVWIHRLKISINQGMIKPVRYKHAQLLVLSIFVQIINIYF